MLNGKFSRREVNYLSDLVSNSDRRNIVLAIVIAIIDISGVGSESRSAILEKYSLINNDCCITALDLRLILARYK